MLHYVLEPNEFYRWILGCATRNALWYIVLKFGQTGEIIHQYGIFIRRRHHRGQSGYHPRPHSRKNIPTRPESQRYNGRGGGGAKVSILYSA